MAEWSSGLPRSDLHRVLYAPGQQAESTRYSIAHLVRPQPAVLMEPLRSGNVIPKDGGMQNETFDGPRVGTKEIRSHHLGSGRGS